MGRIKCRPLPTLVLFTLIGWCYAETELIANHTGVHRHSSRVPNNATGHNAIARPTWRSTNEGVSQTSFDTHRNALISLRNAMRRRDGRAVPKRFNQQASQTNISSPTKSSPPSPLVNGQATHLGHTSSSDEQKANSTSVGITETLDSDKKARSAPHKETLTDMMHQPKRALPLTGLQKSALGEKARKSDSPAGPLTELLKSEDDERRDPNKETLTYLMRMKEESIAAMAVKPPPPDHSWRESSGVVFCSFVVQNTVRCCSVRAFVIKNMRRLSEHHVEEATAVNLVTTTFLK